MKLDKDKCLGGRLNNKDITGIRLNGHDIYYDPFYDVGPYNVYTIKFEDKIVAGLSVEKIDCLIDNELLTDWGNGTIDSNDRHTYLDVDENNYCFRVRTTGFLKYPDGYDVFSVDQIRPDIIDGSYLFDYYTYITTENLTLPETSNMTDMNGMFNGCYNLISLDLSSFDTSKVTRMDGMFQNCHSLISLDLSGFDTSKVTRMSRMFFNCYNLTSLDLSGFDTSKITDIRNMDAMLEDCGALHTLRLIDCSNDTINKIINSLDFPTDTIEGITRKIYVNPDDIGDLEEPENWVFVNYKTGEVINPKPIIPEPEQPEEGSYVPGKFEGSSITEVTTIVNSNHTDLSYMFYHCTNLTTINGIDTWDTSNVTNMKYMFYDCYHLTSLDLSNFDTSNVTDMSYMFRYCDGLTSLDLSNFDTSSVTNMQYMFGGCATALKTLDLRNFDMSNVSNTDYMFTNCDNLRTLRLNNCNRNTISKIINSLGFPTTVTNDGQNRYIYCKRAEASGLTLPSYVWKFEYVD